VKPPPERELSFRLLLLGLAAIGPFSLNIFKPCLPWIRAELDADISTVQLGLSLAMVVAAVATALSGPVADTQRQGSRWWITTSTRRADACAAILGMFGRIELSPELLAGVELL
jgi:MFS family permease